MSGPSLFVPEVVQTSAMDCGPATLKSLLEGFGVPVSYGRLREACQIDLDGTSIDTLEQVAAAAGLEAEQVMVPSDHLLMNPANCLPAIVVVRGPDGLTHFVVAWRKHGPIVQLMDPATGRRWMSSRAFLTELYEHHMTVPASAWREYAGSAEFLDCLRARLRRLRLPAAVIETTLEDALRETGWRAIAAVDACARMVESIVVARGLARGAESANVFRSILRKCLLEAQSAEAVVPRAYWSVAPADDPGSGEEMVRFRGALLVRFTGSRVAAVDPEKVSPELAAALAEPPIRPARQLLHLLTRSGAVAPVAILVALLLAGFGLVVEGLLFRAFFDLARDLELTRQRAAALSSLFSVLVLLLFLDLPIVSSAFRLGRHLEIRLRMAFLQKIPRLGDRYFQSRLTSDMAERSHSLERIRLAPDLGEWFTRTGAELLFAIGGIIWLDPAAIPAVLGLAVAALAVPFLCLPRLQELDLRVRNHAGALSRFHLDALLGLLPVRTHGAQKPVLRQHDGLLKEWSRAYMSLQRAQVITDAIVQTVMVSLTIVLLFDHLQRKGLNGGVLLLVYWALKVLTLSHMLLLSIATQYPSHRNVALRLLEPLGAPEDPTGDDDTVTPASSARGVAIEWRSLSVRAAGHHLLTDVDITIPAGQHVAIVGLSGAGKSTLVGTLLGWHRAASGEIRVDGDLLTASRLQSLRHETAWVDPAVQLWNRSLLENLLYGSADGGPARTMLDDAIRDARLTAVLRKLPHGLQSSLGEGGALVSGGEGQRVRFARAMLRPGVRLAILDEPFRGLDREQRRGLLRLAKDIWRDATLLCITHDVAETLQFERVVVIEGGRIIEDGYPCTLKDRHDSRYRALLEAEEQVRAGLWGGTGWRHLQMAHGHLSEQGGAA